MVIDFDIDNIIMLFYRDEREQLIKYGDIFIYENLLEKLEKNNYFINDIDLPNFMVMEYFKVDDKILGFEHGTRNVSYTINLFNTIDAVVKIKENILDKINIIVDKINLERFINKYPLLDKFKIQEYNENSYVINFSNLVYYKEIKKIIRGVKYRYNWCKNNQDFPKINYKTQNNIYSMFEEQLIYDFYHKDNVETRNLEIYVSMKNHKEYFYKFKKE